MSTATTRLETAQRAARALHELREALAHLGQLDVGQPPAAEAIDDLQEIVKAEMFAAAAQMPPTPEA